jgi:hypothetical protein
MSATGIKDWVLHDTRRTARMFIPLNEQRTLWSTFDLESAELFSVHHHAPQAR